MQVLKIALHTLIWGLYKNNLNNIHKVTCDEVWGSHNDENSDDGLADCDTI
jgi:hypothetical protein